jgi:hypothetical protein
MRSAQGSSTAPVFDLADAFRFRFAPPVSIIVMAALVLAASLLGCRAVSKTAGTKSSAATVGIYRAGTWFVDSNNNGRLDIPEDRSFSFGGTTPDDVPVAGDWNGDGHAKAGLYRNGTWYLDLNGNGVWDPRGDLLLLYGGNPGDVPIVGDWNGDGRDKIGIFRQGFLWILDVNGAGVFKEAVVFPFGGVPGDQPVVGHWNGKKTSQVGIYRQGEWLLDEDGDRKFTPADPVYHFGGLPNDIAVPGDWIGDGRTRLGIYRQGLWILDKNGNGKVDESHAGADWIFGFGGLPGDRPVAAKW